MHPEIKKFWEDAGHMVRGPTLINSYEIYVGQAPIWRIETIAHGNRYRFNSEWYSEEEMLRIVRLKAFI
jgi:hypothetical protein